MLTPPEKADFKQGFLNLAEGDWIFMETTGERYLLNKKSIVPCEEFGCTPPSVNHTKHYVCELMDEDGKIHMERNIEDLRYDRYRGIYSFSLGDGIWVWNGLKRKAELCVVITVESDENVAVVTYVFDKDREYRVNHVSIAPHRQNPLVKKSMFLDFLPLGDDEYSDAASVIEKVLKAYLVRPNPRP